MTEVQSTVSPAPDLSVLGESVERLYRNYRDKRYLVNRRYQRKLVWTVEEKTYFIDSIAKQYPIPLILLAEKTEISDSRYELIDGLQRMISIFSFIENEFPIEGGYFDLNATAFTKVLYDQGILTQKEPILDRKVCVNIASYQVPLSIFESPTDGLIEDVFRRINSGGRKLSRQDLRAAGALGRFADLVRRISMLVRGDVTSSDEVLLNEVKKVSLTSRNLDYGINTETLLWVTNGILNKDQVRESRDEELIADILAYMILSEPPPSRSEHMDDYFGMREGDASATRFREIETAVAKLSEERVIDDFARVYDELSV